MCEVMEKYEKIAADSAVQKERIKMIQEMLKNGFEKDIILKMHFTEDEYSEAESQLMQLA